MRKRYDQCTLTLDVTLDVHDSVMKAYKLACCDVVGATCTGLYSNLKFDIITKITGNCAASFEYEESRDFTLYSNGWISIEVSPSFKIEMSAGLVGSIEMKIPGEAKIYPNFVKNWISKSSAKLGKPTFTNALSAETSITATAGIGLAARALGVVSAGLAAEVELGGTAGLSLMENGKIKMKSNPSAELTATASLKFTYGLELPSIPNLPDVMCDAKLSLTFDPDSMMPTIGGEHTLFEKTVTINKGTELAVVPMR